MTKPKPNPLTTKPQRMQKDNIRLHLNFYALDTKPLTGEGVHFIKHDNKDDHDAYHYGLESAIITIRFYRKGPIHGLCSTPFPSKKDLDRAYDVMKKYIETNWSKHEIYKEGGEELRRYLLAK